MKCQALFSLKNVKQKNKKKKKKKKNMLKKRKKKVKLFMLQFCLVLERWNQTTIDVILFWYPARIISLSENRVYGVDGVQVYSVWQLWQLCIVLFI